MGRFPNSNIIGASYGSDLVRKFGRRARSIVKQRAYSRIFDTGLSVESSAADEWELTSGSTYMGGGILSGITGNRADGIVWDDLIKGREQADSQTIRNKTWDAYFDDLLTRKKPGAWEVGITTRWHEDDVAGRILPSDYKGQTGWVDGRDGNKWFVVCFPAECERSDEPLGRQIGDRIWPEWFGPDHFAPFKTSTRTWSSLYQQRPAPDEGNFFKREWFQYYDTPPDNVHVYGASDYAVTDGGGDFTVHVTVAADADGNVYVTDVWRGQKTPDVWIEAALDMMRDHSPLGWAEENGQIIKSIGPFLERRANERKIYCMRQQFASTHDKATRARTFQASMSSGKVFLPRKALWLADMEGELLSFPAGRHDDQVDALSLVFRMLADMTGKSIIPEKLPVDQWDRAFDRLDEDAEGSWKTQ
jgi:predicted phage terminase large subunit-like protein